MNSIHGFLMFKKNIKTYLTAQKTEFLELKSQFL